MKKKIGLVFGILISLVILAILVDYFIILSPKNNINKFINNTFSYIDSNIKDIGNKTSMVSKGDLILNTNINEYTNINGYSAIYDIEYDKKNEALLLDLKLGDSEESMSGKLLVSDKNLYISFPNLIASMINMPLESNIKLNINNDDLLYLSKIIKDSIVEIINNSNNYSKGIQNLNIKTTYKFTSNEINNIIEKINKDSKAKNILNDIFNLKLKNVSNEKYYDLIVTRDFVGNIKGITFENDELSFVYTDNRITLTVNNTEVFNAYIKENSVSGTIYSKSNKINYIINASSIDNGTSYDGSLKFNLEKNQYIKVDFTNSLSYNIPLSEIDISQSKNINELSDKDMQIINDALSMFDSYLN